MLSEVCIYFINFTSAFLAFSTEHCPMRFHPIVQQWFIAQTLGRADGGATARLGSRSSPAGTR